MLNLTKCMDFAQFLTQTCNESCSNYHWHTEVVQTKFNMSTIHLDNHRQFFLIAGWSLGSMCPGLSESNNRLARVLAAQFLKFRYDTSSFAMLSIWIIQSPDSPEYLRASFPVTWTLAHESGAQVIHDVAWSVLRPVETDVIVRKTVNVLHYPCSTMWSQ